MKRLKNNLFHLALLALIVTGCESADSDPMPGVNIDDSDEDIPGDTDPDTGTTDGDSDSDSDTDSDADEDAGNGDAGPLSMDCSDCSSVGGTLDNMLCAIDLCDESVVAGNSVEVLTPSVECVDEDMYEAVPRFGLESNDLEPRLNDSYALLASGPATGTSHTTSCDGASPTSLSDPWSDDDTMHDVIEWTLTLTAPEEAQSFRFKYVFFSQEYDDFISSGYNDKFYVVLEADSTNSGAPTVINYTDCRAPDSYVDFTSGEGCDLPSGNCCYIAINSAFSECCWYPHQSVYAPNSSDPSCPDGYATTDISGTGYECAGNADLDGASNGSSTGWLQTAWPISGGETFAITFHIHDTYDAYLDSEVLLDAFEFLGVVEQGTDVVIE